MVLFSLKKVYCTSAAMLWWINEMMSTTLITKLINSTVSFFLNISIKTFLSSLKLNHNSALINEFVETTFRDCSLFMMSRKFALAQHTGRERKNSLFTTNTTLGFKVSYGIFVADHQLKRFYVTISRNAVWPGAI